MLPGLTSFTGGVLLTPFVYLIFEFLRQQHRYQLGLDTHNPPLRTSLIIWCSLFLLLVSALRWCCHLKLNVCC